MNDRGNNQADGSPVRKTRRGRRGGGGGGGREQHHPSLQIDDALKLNDLQSPLSCQPQTHEPTTSTPRNHRNPRSASGNRGAHVFKPRFVKKSELGSSSTGGVGSSSNGVVVGSSSSKNEQVGALNDEVGSLSIGEGESGQQAKQEEERVGASVENAAEVSERGKEEDDNAVTRLEELQRGVEEPELSEEQLRINDQAQEDELLAMESIFGDNVIILERQRGLRCFQIRIHIEAPGEIAVSTKLNSSSDLKYTSSSSDDFSYSFTVQHLPPIMLTCALPKSYPSHQPPYFTLSVQWLDSIKISNLCSMLDSLWMDQQGQEVIYQWVEWLQSSSLSHLGFNEEIMLGPYGSRDAGDRRALTGIVSPDADIPFLRSYNNDRLHENFRNSLQECCICFTEYAGAEFVRLPCKHFFCWKCMKTYSDMHVKEGTITKLNCPDTKCQGMIPPGLLKRLLGDEEFERWESLMLEKTLDSMSDVVSCPRCKTPCIEDEDDHAQCSKCFFSFCTLCWERRHVGVQCMTPEMKLRILQERQNFSQLGDEQKRREKEMINEILSVRVILSDAKQCPACNMAISRVEGCNKMVCENCGQYFCYNCGSGITGYEHFRDGQCELFPQETIRNWQAQMNPRQNLGQIHAEQVAELVAQQVAVHGQLCPSCGQFNAKFNNNNHISCWACQHHFCYLCKETVRRSSQHYGPKGCKQHTPG
ncbi:putative chromatin regulator PHD family [Rosa chinensis]|uniref:RBR-type E3 ubiquitin transferase n=1 Tax=Rosa chinensis TaxID=74649 RepID=A0A2P6PA81_ROSCH|nr:E3 ubiquitin-protein ligase RNF14 [Rosa chinensis]PRQ18822.1 putative chromatin regulator PHD family [Rosa chinensis]